MFLFILMFFRSHLNQDEYFFCIFSKSRLPFKSYLDVSLSFSLQAKIALQALLSVQGVSLSSVQGVILSTFHIFTTL